MSFPTMSSSWDEEIYGDNVLSAPVFPYNESGSSDSITERIVLNGSGAGDPTLTAISGDEGPPGTFGPINLQDWSTILLILTLSGLVVVTIVGNVLVCLSVVLVRKLRKPQNYLLVSLALSDFFVALFVMPFAIVFEVHEGSWPLEFGLCDLWVSASILNLCAISCDRYRAITSPLEYSSKTTPRLMMAWIFVVWLLSACVSLPPVLLLGNVHEDGRDGPGCSVSQNFWYQIYATMASFYVPLCVMVVVYFKILRVVADKKKQMCWKNQAHSQRNSSSATAHSVNCTLPLLPPKKDSVDSTRSPLINQSNAVTAVLALNGGSRRGTNSFTLTSSSSSSRGSGSCTAPLTPPNTTITVVTNTTPATLTVNNNYNKGQQNGGVYVFPTNALHRLKREKLLGGLKEHKAYTVLGIIMSAFVICWLPFFILAIARPFLTIHHIEITPWISSLFNWLGYANSALNPIIFAVVNRDFRLPFREILCFRCGTLDSMMRREFYHQQYGDDRENVERRLSRQTQGTKGLVVGIREHIEDVQPVSV